MQQESFDREKVTELLNEIDICVRNNKPAIAIIMLPTDVETGIIGVQKKVDEKSSMVDVYATVKAIVFATGKNYELMGLLSGVLGRERGLMNLMKDAITVVEQNNFLNKVLAATDEQKLLKMKEQADRWVKKTEGMP